MIAKSDIVILSAASALLLLALLRLEGPSANLGTSTYYTPKKTVAAPSGNTNTTSTTTNTETTVALNTTTPNSTDPAGQIESSTNVESGTTAELGTTATETPSVVQDPDVTTHIVKQGEYLGLIARRYNTTVAELKKLNNLQGNIILVGQELLYPAN